MAKLIPAAERILRARELIQKARDIPVPQEGLGKSDFSYIANVKDLLRQARDMVKFIPMTAGVSAEMKAEVVVRSVDHGFPQSRVPATGILQAADRQLVLVELLLTAANVAQILRPAVALQIKVQVGVQGFLVVAQHECLGGRLTAGLPLGHPSFGG